MRLSFLLLTFLCVPAFAQSEGPARQVLRECTDSLAPEVVGIDDIEAACPGVTDALEALGLTELLFEPQLATLSRDGLNALVALADRYEQPPERTSASVDSLAPVLESLRKPPTPELQKSWYQRFREWLRQTFDQPEAQTDPWLIRWLEEHEMPEIVQKVLVYGVMLLVVVLAVLIIINEARAAASGRRPRRVATASDAGAAALLAGDDQNIDVPGERPSALLKVLIATLVKTGRVQGAQGLTHRELTRRARFDDTRQRESFQKIAQVAEREVFGGKALANDELDEVLRDGRSLEAQLNSAAT